MSGSTTPSNNLTANITQLPVPSLTSTVAPLNVDQPKDSIIYLVALISAVSFLALFVSVMLFYVRKKRLDKLRHQLMPFYSFDPHEEDGDWESDLLDDNLNVGGNTRRNDYKSVEFSKSSNSQTRRL